MRSAWVVPMAAVALLACSPASDVASTGARRAETSTTTPPRPTPPTTATTAPTTTRPGGSITWGPCDRFGDAFVLTDMVGLDRDGLECARFAVPIDYGDPRRGALELAVARFPATDPQRRIGSLFLNPGGPGGSGLEFLPQFIADLDPDLRDLFDLVSFDPRGVGLSTPVVCRTPAERERDAAEDPTPDDDTELAAQLAARRNDNAACLAAYPDLVPALGTVNVARDLDRLREAVGDETLTYLGFSYGTAIGATYAQLFPQRVGRLVLDGSVPPVDSLTLRAEGQFAGFRRAFERFVAACEQDRDCPLDDARAAVGELLRRAATDPLPTLDDRPLTEARAYTAIGATLYDESAWPQIWDAVDQALQGQLLGSAVLGLLADIYAGRRPDGSWNNSDEAFTAVTCADLADRPTLAEVRPRAIEMVTLDPLWGPGFAYAPLMCDGTAPAREPIPQPLTAPGTPPILVVGTTGDPATPYEWAQQMAASLESGVLLTFDGDGHTAWGSSACATAAMVAFLSGSPPPAAGTVCTT